MSRANYDAAQLNHNENYNRNTNIENSTNTDENDPGDTNHGQINGQVDLSGTTDDDSAHALSDDPSLQHAHMTNGHSGGDGSLSPNGTGSDGGLDGDGMGMGDSQGSSEGDQEYYCDGFDQDLRRVKVYELVGSRWTDRGTAFCQGNFDADSQEARLVARSESNLSLLILNTTIRPDDAYHRQQDTLIVWTEVDGTDYALSFQDAEGCSEVWDFITEVQKHMGMRGAQPPLTTAQVIVQSGGLPHPEAGIMDEIEKAIKSYCRNPKVRESVCEYIQQEKYIQSMIEIFHAAEEQEDIDGLHSLHRCLTTIILLNEHTIYDHILHDDLWLGVIGIMEYDPEFPKYKANYREFFSQRSKFLQPIKISNEVVQTKIHHTYRLQYLKDVILGRILDDSTFNVLSSCIHFNQMDIITHIQSDERFLNDLVGVFMHTGTDNSGKGKARANLNVSPMDVDKTVVNGNGARTASSSTPSTSQSSSATSQDSIETRKRDIILLLQQLCVIGKNVQLQARIILFKTLIDRGVLFAVQWALCQHDRPLVNIGGEILSVLLDHNTAGVRLHVGQQGHMLQQHPYNPSKDTIAHVEAQPPQNHQNVQGDGRGRVPLTPGPLPYKESIMQVLCRMLADSQDFALQSQLADAIRLMLEIQLSELQPEAAALGASKPAQRQPKDDPITDSFLENFYNVSVDTLFRPILNDVSEHQTLQGPTPTFHVSRERANLYLYLCDLLCSFVHQHSFRSYYFILRTKIAARIATLLYVRDKHLCLAALRFFRVCLRNTNKNMLTHLMSLDVFTPIVNLAIREAKRDSLLSCTCQEFFEYLRKDNNKPVIANLMSKHSDKFRELATNSLGAATFQGLISRHEMNVEPPPKQDEEKRPTRAMPDRGWGQGRLLEIEEEDYFNNDDEEEELAPLPVTRIEPQQPLGNPLRRRRQRAGVAVGLGPTPIRPRPQPQPIVPSQRPESPLSSLLMYEGDDDEDDDVIIGPQPASVASTSRLGSESEAQPASIMSHRQIQIEIPAYDPADEQEPEPDPEDDLLEALVTNKSLLATTKAEPSPSSKPNSDGALLSSIAVSKALGDVPPIQRDKRRRDEEDDDDGMLRLAAKSKRANSVEATTTTTTTTSTPTPTTTPVSKSSAPTPVPSLTSASTGVTSPSPSKPTEDAPPKRFKLVLGNLTKKFGGGNATSQQQTQSTASKPSPKDSDGG